MTIAREVGSDVQRSVFIRLKNLLKYDNRLVPRYTTAKKVIRFFRRPAFYEISSRCNLKCEGCYYYDSEPSNQLMHEAPLPNWREFFRAEADRGVSMPYFVGAEPALEQDRLNLAANYFKCGNIGTNGSIRIDSSIPFRISIAAWGAGESDRHIRGADILQKAFKNYEGDPRAIILYTVNRWNISEVSTIAAKCRDAGIPLTLNIYSPTSGFLSKLRSEQKNDDRFFRLSRPHNNPCLAPRDLVRARETIARLIDDYPETVIYSHA